ncbi:MAG: hypothetical protein EXR60_03770 [Dehalococcoidia bacterium]|nr:hypothetical protein [Dehalococcoidia bacterium]
MVEESKKIPIPGARKIDGYLTELQEEKGLELMEDDTHIMLVRWRGTDEGRGPVVSVQLVSQLKTSGPRERIIRTMLVSLK